MKTKTVKRYFCDHCRKGSLRRSSMETHERGCVRNPQRYCPLCHDWQLKQEPMETLLAAFTDRDNLGPLREAAHGCPACMLATIVQCRHMYVNPNTDDDEPLWIDFDYKKEVADFRSELRTEDLAY